MEELYRFSLLRPANRTDAVTVLLERNSRFQSIPAGKTINGELDPAPPSLEAIAIINAQPTPAAPDKWTPWRPVWKGFEKASLAYILGKPKPIVTPPPNQTTLNFIKSIPSFPVAKGAKALLKTLEESHHDTWVTQAKSFAEPFIPAGAKSRLDDFDTRLADVFLALMILRCGGSSNLHAIIRANQVPPQIADILMNQPTLDGLGELLRLDYLIYQIVANPSPITTAADISAILNASLLLPPKIFLSFQKPVRAIGVTDLLVVKQHVLRYELGEIARIENILKGESRDHTQKHTLSNERDTFLQTTDTTTTDQELTSNDHVSLSNAVQTVLNEDTKVDAGLHAQYTGVVNIQADLTVAYDKSSTESKQSATEMAKDVTQKAAKIVTDQVVQSTTTKIIETFEETEKQGFQNKLSVNISGVYQWVEKVYLAQVFNYGKRLMFDIMVPEPAASLLAADTVPDKKRPLPPAPFGTVLVYPAIDPKTLLPNPKAGQPILDDDGNPQVDKPLTPDQLTDIPTDAFGNPNFGFYGKWVALYKAQGVVPPPPETITVSWSKSWPFQDNQYISTADTVAITDGYASSSADISAGWIANDDSITGTTYDGNPPNISAVTVIVGGQKAAILYTPITGARYARDDSKSSPVPRYEETISVAVQTADVDALAVNVEIICSRTDKLFAKWQLQTYQAIAGAWQSLQEDYTTKLEAMKLDQQQNGILGDAPAEQNRETEQKELKRSCIAILANDQTTIDGTNSIDEWNPDDDSTKPMIFADPHIASDANNAETVGAWVRWFEQAFDWENISYVFYPYFWARSQKWMGKLQRKYDSDPLFENFLQAGYARVVIPVRPGFNKAVNFYMATGKPWMGGDLPHLGDKTYLSITEEIKEQTGAPGKEKPVGNPWEIRLPTSLIKLRQDDKLPPDWVWIGHEKDYQKGPNGQLVLNDPPGTWNWKGDTGG